MSEYHFMVGRGRIPDEARAKQIDRIAREHGASFTAVDLPGDGPRYWFSCPNRGAPFDGAVSAAVRKALEAAGFDPSNLKGGAR